jgi:hypothetical protein
MKKVLLLFFLLTPFLSLRAQQTVSIGSTDTRTNAILYLNSPSGNQGLIVPIVNNRSSIASPGAEKGMIVFDNSDNKLYYHNGTAWIAVEPGTGGGSGVEVDGIIGNEVTQVSSTGGLVLTGAGTAASALTVGLIPGTANGQVLKWNASTSKWELGTDNGGGTVTFDDTTINLNGSSQLQVKDLGISTAKIANDAVTSAKILDGTIANADIATNAAIAPSKIGPASATSGQVLKWNGTAWAPAADNAGISATLASGQIVVGNASNVATAVTMSGDATIVNTGVVTLANSAVTSAKIADGTIANADIDASAAIAGTKVSPNFGSQLVSTTGGLNASGTITFPALAGTGSRLVVANATGVLGTQPVPSVFSTSNVIPKGDGSSGLVSSQLFDDGTNIGIGTNSPTRILDLNSGSASYGYSHSDGTIRMSTYTGTLSGGGVGGSIGTESNHPFFIYVANSGEKATFLPNGNVGIGTNTPYNKLTLFGPGNSASDGGHMSFITSADAHPTIQVMNWGHNDNAILFDSYLSTTNSWTSSGVASNFKIHKSSNLQFDYASGVAAGSNISSWSTAMSINPSGFIGFGTTSPAYPLEMVKNQSLFIANLINSNTGSGADVLRLQIMNATPDNSAFYVACYAGSPTGNLRGGLRNDGAGGVQVYTSSDRRLKENIEDSDEHGIETIMKIRPRKYNFVGFDQSKTGFIAQELQEVFPAAVSGDPDGDVRTEPMMVSNNELIPLLIKGFQEQQQIIENQKTETENLKAALRQQQKLIDNLETKMKSLEASKNGELDKLKDEVAQSKRTLGKN